MGDPAGRGHKLRAYGVHLLTAAGIGFAFLAAVEILRNEPRGRWFFSWLLAAVLLDALDGPLARRWQVERYAPSIRGRTIDEIVDYLTFVFLPLVYLWRTEALLPPAGLWIVVAMMASLFGFAHTSAKQEGGFFRGFPSYWNVFVFYVGLDALGPGPATVTVLLLALGVLTVSPVRFLYPNLAPRPWRAVLLAGAAVWILLLLALLAGYPSAPLWLVLLSLVYPLVYLVLSVHLGLSADRSRGD